MKDVIEVVYEYHMNFESMSEIEHEMKSTNQEIRRLRDKKKSLSKMLKYAKDTIGWEKTGDQARKIRAGVKNSFRGIN